MTQPARRIIATQAPRSSQTASVTASLTHPAWHRWQEGATVALGRRLEGKDFGKGEDRS
jgi:hypothetical protein